MTRYFKATIDVLIEADNEAEASDAISEALRPMLKEFEPSSSWIDWRYADSTLAHPLPDSGEGFEYAAGA